MELELSSEEKLFLIRVARDTLVSVFSRMPLVEYYRDKKLFEQKAGVFIKILVKNEPRAYGGILIPQKPLVETIQECVLKAGFQDEHTKPLKAEELDKASFQISLVCSVEDVVDRSHIDPATEGLWAEDGCRQGVLLPWDIRHLGLTPEDYVRETCVKSGISDPSRAKLKKMKLISFGENA